ncbi:ribosome rescue protein RqcH [Halosegnis sp.]|uniref:ribosome rescue protein RqcH n=1 Tax=Halosegnis sp. TaxID=2864959 RepID=UPI0035D4245E
MDQKRAMTSVDIRALARELRDYEGAKLDKAYLYDDDLVRLKLRDFDRGRVELLVEVGDPKRAHVADPSRVPDAPGRPPDFAKMLRNRLSGADLAGVHQHEFDRILVFEFSREDADTLVVAELFGDGNVVVMNRDREVIDCLDTVRLKSRTVAPGAVYDFPASRFDPLDCSREAFDAKMRESNTDLVRTLATQHNLGGVWAEELCTRAGVEKERPIDEATSDDYDALFGALERLRDRLQTGDLDPRVYWETDDGERSRPVDATPMPLAEYEGVDCDGYDRFTGALEDYFYELDREEPDPGSTRPDFESEIAKYERIIDQQEGAIEEFEKEAAIYREKAETLYGNYDLVDEVLATVREARAADYSWGDVKARFEEAAEAGNERARHVIDVDPEHGEVTLELEGRRINLVPEDGVEKNADRLYREAKRVEEKKEGALAAIEDTRGDLAEVKRRREAWSEETSADNKEDDQEPGETDWLAKENVPVRYDEQWYEQFRWFHTSDGFLVIGGRNADQNEAIVKKYMDGDDLFFHAQAHGGPVTVLKATGPSEPSRDVDIPQSSKEEAARFAVTHSSVWKDGKFEGDVYMVDPGQVSKTPESGEYLEKGGFTIRGDRTYFENTSVDCAIGVQCEPETRVLGGPEQAIVNRVETHVRLEPGRYAQNDIAKMIYRDLKQRFTDESFLRKVASPDQIQEFCPPGGSRLVD